MAAEVVESVAISRYDINASRPKANDALGVRHNESAHQSAGAIDEIVLSVRYAGPLRTRDEDVPLRRGATAAANGCQSIRPRLGTDRRVGAKGLRCRSA